MKKILTVVLIVLCLCLVGCNKEQSNTDVSSKNNNTTGNERIEYNGWENYKDNQTWTINNLSITLGKTTLNDIISNISYEEELLSYNGDVFTLVLEDINGKEVGNNSVTLTLHSPSLTEFKNVNEYVISGIDVFKYDDNIDVNLPGLSLKGYNTYEAFENDYLFLGSAGLEYLDEGYNYDLKAHIENMDCLHISGINYESPIMVALESPYDGFKVDLYDLNYVENNEDFTENYMNEIRINGEIFTINSKVSEFTDKDYIYLKNTSTNRTDFLVDSGDTSDANLMIISRETGKVQDISIKVYNNTDEDDLSILDCMIVEFAIHNNESDVLFDMCMYENLFSENREYALTEIINVFGSPDYNPKEDDDSHYQIYYSLDGPWVDLFENENNLHFLVDVLKDGTEIVNMATWEYEH